MQGVQSHAIRAASCYGHRGEVGDDLRVWRCPGNVTQSARALLGLKIAGEWPTISA